MLQRTTQAGTSTLVHIYISSHTHIDEAEGRADRVSENLNLKSNETQKTQQASSGKQPHRSSSNIWLKQPSLVEPPSVLYSRHTQLISVSVPGVLSELSERHSFETHWRATYRKAALAFVSCVSCELWCVRVSSGLLVCELCEYFRARLLINIH